MICGTDEAGRGPIAGPVVAAAVILDPENPIEGLNDSKKLSEKKRNRLSAEIKDKALYWAIAQADVEEIDRINILWASMNAMTRAVEALPVQPSKVLVDCLFDLISEAFSPGSLVSSLFEKQYSTFQFGAFFPLTFPILKGLSN